MGWNMGLLTKLGKYALIGAASVLIYEAVTYVTVPQAGYRIETIGGKQYVVDVTATPPDTVAAPKLFQVYGMYKDNEGKTVELERRYSVEKGWYESRRAQHAQAQGEAR